MIIIHNKRAIQIYLYFCIIFIFNKYFTIGSLCNQCNPYHHLEILALSLFYVSSTNGSYRFVASSLVNVFTFDQDSSTRTTLGSVRTDGFYSPYKAISILPILFQFIHPTEIVYDPKIRSKIAKFAVPCSWFPFST